MSKTRRRLEQTALENWAAVDDVLREIGEIDLQIESMEAELTRQVARLKEDLAFRARPMAERKAMLERLVKEFTEAHREGLDGKKTKELNFGKLGFRLSTRVVIKSVKSVLAALRAKGMTDCISVKESVDKEALKKYDEAAIESVGASLKKEDVFWYEVNRDRLREV